MAMFIPHGNYPKDHTFNSVTDNPRLFKEVEFSKFLKQLPPERLSDFMQSELFLHSCLYQDNPMTSLIMLLSAIERAVSSKHVPLEGLLNSKDFKAKMVGAKDGEVAFKLLQEEIAKHTESYGSAKSVVSFFTDNLTNEQKLKLIGGITLAHKYKKTTPPKGSSFVAMYTPVYEPSSIDVNDSESVNEALKKRIKAVVYDIRNGFVHRSRWIPFGNEEYIKKQGVYTHERFENGEPKDTWLIRMTFKQLHELAVEAYQTFWLNEYRKTETG